MKTRPITLADIKKKKTRPITLADIKKKTRPIGLADIKMTRIDHLTTTPIGG